MKQRILCVCLSLLLFLLCGCAFFHGEDGTTDSNADNTTDSTTDETTTTTIPEDAILAVDSKGNTGYVWVGMSFSDYFKTFPEPKYVAKTHYEYLTSAEGDDVLVYVNREKDPKGVVEVKSYPSREGLPTDADFALIKVGMSFDKLVELVGFSDDVPTSGYLMLRYYSAEGNEYRIIIDDQAIEINGVEYDDAGVAAIYGLTNKEDTTTAE